EILGISQSDVTGGLVAAGAILLTITGATFASRHTRPARPAWAASTFERVGAGRQHRPHVLSGPTLAASGSPPRSTVFRSRGRASPPRWLDTPQGTPGWAGHCRPPVPCRLGSCSFGLVDVPPDGLVWQIHPGDS